MRIHIFGAASGIGRWFAEQVFDASTPVYAYDINPQVKDVFEQSHVRPVHLNTLLPPSPDSGVGAFCSKDWLLFAVPESSLANLCGWLKPLLAADVSVAVMTSRQASPVACVKQILKRARVVGLHPLFGPQVASPYGQSVALCTTEGNTGLEFGPLVDLMSRSGLKVIYKTVTEHDQDMIHIQALTHFILLSFARLMGESGRRMLALAEMRTPPFQFLAAFTSRLLMQSATTPADIQADSAHRQVRGLFLEVAEQLHSVFSQGDSKQIAEEIDAIKSRFSQTVLKESAHYSDMAVSALQEREKLYFKKLEQRALVVFRVREANEWRVGLIERVLDFSLELTEFVDRVEVKGRMRIPCPVNEATTEAYRRQGVHVSTGSRLSIQKEQLELLPAAETLVWLKDNLLPVERVADFPNPLQLKGEFLSHWLPRLFRKLWQCTDVSRTPPKDGTTALCLFCDPTVNAGRLKEGIQAFMDGRPLSSEYEEE